LKFTAMPGYMDAGLFITSKNHWRQMRVFLEQ
jgi:hypothetical protein